MTSPLPQLNFVQATQADLPPSDFPPVSVRDLRNDEPGGLGVHGGGYYNAANSLLILAPADQDPSTTPPVSVAALGRPLHGGGYVAPGSYCNIAPEHRDVAWSERAPATTAAASPPPQQAVAGHTATWHPRRAPDGYKIVKKSRSWAFWRRW